MIQELMQKLNGIKNNLEEEEDKDVLSKTIQLLVGMYNENRTMGDVLHSIQTAMRLLGQQ